MTSRTYLGLSPIGFHKLHYLEWGKADAPVLLCVHGLTRNAHDFDYLARVLSSRYRVIAVDIVGRGESDYFPQEKLYTFPQYLSDLNALIARLNVSELSWLGTSMGGLLGMIMAAQKGTPLKKLIINDVGPFIPVSWSNYIRERIKIMPTFTTLQQAESFMRQAYKTFGELTDSQWQHMAQYGTRKNQDGTLSLAYDSKIAEAIPWSENANLPDLNLWPFWQQIKLPTLLLRGKESLLLIPDIVQQMKTLKPDLEIVEFEGVGHAPALMDDNQIKVIQDWL
ncbi:MAG: alpha/beta hydrolase [Proteobacteria bacterium]|nr:alpha/beta hydrolase [Pseudomonadota bacterium]